MEDYTKDLLEAYRYALSSPDPSTQNGGVLLNPGGDIIGVGFNHFPAGVDQSHWHNREAKYLRVVHAETGAIIDAARRGNSTFESTLVCPWAACSNCAKHIADAGVQTLVRHTFSNNGVTTGNHWYEDCLIGDEIMKQAGVKIIEVDPVPSKIELRRNGELWSPGAENALA